jgi:hypothetical protein
MNKDEVVRHLAGGGLLMTTDIKSIRENIVTRHIFAVFENNITYLDKRVRINFSGLSVVKQSGNDTYWKLKIPHKRVRRVQVFCNFCLGEIWVNPGDLIDGPGLTPVSCADCQLERKEIDNKEYQELKKAQAVPGNRKRIGK